jgi:undecaprenyl pyrophosphate phosphatase UppP
MEKGWIGFIAGFIVGVIAMGITLTIIESKQPKPIDVYRGRTALKITYEDSIPVDTAVVFRHNI